MSFKKQIAYNTLVQVFGKVILGPILSIILVIILTRYLGVGGYGQYNTAFAFVGFFITLADLGIYTILVRELAQKPNEREKILGNIFLLRILTGLAIFLLAFLFAFFMPYPKIVKLSIGLAALWSFFYALSLNLFSIFQIYYRMDIATLIESISQVVILILTIFAIKLNLGLLGIFWILVPVGFLNLALTYIFSRRFIKFKLVYNSDFIKQFLKETLPMGIVIILWLMHLKIDTIILSIKKSAFDVGIYGVPHRIFEVLFVIPTIFTVLLFPKYSELFFNNKNVLRDFFQKSFDILLIIVFPIIIFFYFFAPHIIQITAGSDFLSSSLVFRILILALFCFFLYAPIHYLIISAKKQKLLMIGWGGLSVLNLFLNFVLIARFSYLGAAITTLITEALAFILFFILAGRILKICPQFNLLKKVALPVIFCLGFSWLLSSIPYLKWDEFIKMSVVWQVFAVSISFLLIFIFYGGLTMLFKVISQSSIKEIVKKNP